MYTYTLWHRLRWTTIGIKKSHNEKKKISKNSEMNYTILFYALTIYNRPKREIPSNKKEINKKNCNCSLIMMRLCKKSILPSNHFPQKKYHTIKSKFSKFSKFCLDFIISHEIFVKCTLTVYAERKFHANKKNSLKFNNCSLIHNSATNLCLLAVALNMTD